MIMTIGNLAFSSVYYKKKKKCDRLYTIFQMVGQTEPQFLSDPMLDRKKQFSPTLD